MTEQTTRIALDTLGCKLNQAESELLARQLARAGYQLVSPADGADIYILNTCTVTHIADRKARHRLRQAHQRNPDARLVAIGCYAQRAPQELSQIDGVSLILDNESKMQLLPLLEESGYLGGPVQPAAVGPQTRTRAFVRVQDGCDGRCAYCIVPMVRGREVSFPAGEVIDEVKQRGRDGYQEVVLTGTEIGSYRHRGLDLKDLLERILAETQVARLRLSSLQPGEITPEFISLWRNGQLCRHFHLSLQSGNDDVLTRMKRGYSTSDYQQAVAVIRELVPEAAITTDVIVGFPGETGEEFAHSLAFYRQAGFARIHVFPYSPRPGTQAAHLPGQVDSRVKRERGREMLALAEEAARSFRQKFVNKTRAVLWEKQTGGVWAGLTDNYIRVYTRSSDDLTNRLQMAKLTEIREDGVWGVTPKLAGP